MAKRSTKINALAKGMNIWCAESMSLNRMNTFRVTPDSKLHFKYCANIANMSISKFKSLIY